MNPILIVLLVVVALVAIAAFFLINQAHKNHVTVQQQAQQDITELRSRAQKDVSDLHMRISVLEIKLAAIFKTNQVVAASVPPPAPATPTPNPAGSVPSVIPPNV